MDNVNIAIFASGSGTNAQNIIKYLESRTFENRLIIEVKLVLSNKPDAYVLERARQHNIETQIFSADTLKNSVSVDTLLKNHNIDFIVLAGFLLKFPDRLVNEYRGRIINLHPSLLPKYGGKGMYGSAVHAAVIQSGDTESGITVHLVDEKYDNGETIFRAKCSIQPGETTESLEAKIRDLERAHFPTVVCNYILKYIKERR